MNKGQLTELAELYESEKKQVKLEEDRKKQDLKEQTQSMLSELNMAFAKEQKQKKKQKRKEKKIITNAINSIDLTRVLKRLDESISKKNKTKLNQPVEVVKIEKPTSTVKIKEEPVVDDIDSDVSTVVEALRDNTTKVNEDVEITQLVYRGDWDVKTNYLPGDVVLFKLSSFVCLKSSRGDQPTHASGHWNIFASRGQDGKTTTPGSGVGPEEAKSIATTLNVSTATSSLSIGTKIDVLLVDASSGPVTATLYSAVGNGGKNLYIKKIDGSVNSVIVDGFGTQTIDGAETFSLECKDESIRVISASGNWYII